MKTRLFSLILFVVMGFSAFSQDLSLTFMSQTDSKFFVYLDGKLQNEQSKGYLTIDSLEYRYYVVRVVMDEPYEVAITKKIKPTDVAHFYKVNFNVVKERVFLKLAKDDRQTFEDFAAEAQPEVSPEGESIEEAQPEDNSPRRRRQNGIDTDTGWGTTGASIKKVKTNKVMDEK